MLREEITPDESWIHPALLMDDDDDDDDGEALDVLHIGSIPLNGLRVFCEFILAKKRNGKLNTKATLARLLVLCHQLDVSEMRKVSLTSMAELVGCTRALLSVYQCELRDFAEMSCHGGKSASARESYARAASAAWTRRRERVGQGDDGSVNASPRQSSCEVGA